MAVKLGTYGSKKGCFGSKKGSYGSIKAFKVISLGIYRTYKVNYGTIELQVSIFKYLLKNLD